MKRFFDTLYGNEHARNRLGNALLESKLPHAFLFDGPAGSGKYTFALQIAKALNCENKASDRVPCCNCNNCRRIDEGLFPDVKLLGKAADKATIGVNEIKDFRADMFLSSTESDYKIYIIKDAEKMTPEAQNALLIILEEPPKNVIIMLLTSGSEKILTTIKSRAQYVGMTIFDIPSLREYLLENNQQAKLIYNASSERFDEILVSSNGRIGVALDLLDTKNSLARHERRQTVMKIVSSFAHRSSYTDLYTAVNSLPSKRAELTDYFEEIINALRDMLLSYQAEEFNPLFFTSSENARDARREVSYKKLLNLYDIMNKAHEDNLKNANITTLLNTLCAKIKTA